MNASAQPSARGFTLIELALALFLITLLFGSVFVPVRTQLDARRVEQTERLLAHAREALLGYAAARGHFPCPADAASSGQESARTDHVTGVCPAYHGYLPAATLGMTGTDTDGYLRDAWSTSANRIRYAVARDTVGTPANARTFTRVNGMRAAGIANLSDPALSLLHVCASGNGVAAGVSCGKAPTVVSTAPVVVWAVGANASSGGTSTHEAQNPNPNGGSADRIFVSAVRSDAPGVEYDDLVAWIPMSLLVGRMVAAGAMP